MCCTFGVRTPQNYKKVHASQVTNLCTKCRYCVLPLWQQSVVGQKPWPVKGFVEVAVSGLNGVGSEQDGRLGRAVNFVGQDGVLHLQVEEAEGDVLDYLLGDVLRVELGTEFELKWVFLFDVLAHHLQMESSLVEL